jgi:hypothetical protein
MRWLAVLFAAMVSVSSGGADRIAPRLPRTPHFPLTCAYYALGALAAWTLVVGILKLRRMHIDTLAGQRRTAELQREIAMRRLVEKTLKQAREDDAVRARDELHFHAGTMR